MNDAELQALWQAQAHGLPTAFSVDELARRGGVETSELAMACAPAEERRLVELERRLQVRFVPAWGAWFLVAVGGGFLFEAGIAGAPWILEVAAAAVTLVVLVRQAAAWLTVRRELEAVRRLQERAMDALRLPSRLFAAALVASLALPPLLVGVALRPPPPPPREQPTTGDMERWVADCRAAGGGTLDLEQGATACERMLEGGVLDAEAISSARWVLAARDCERGFAQAKALYAEGAGELALDAWKKLPEECLYRTNPRHIPSAMLEALGLRHRGACQAVLDGGVDAEVVRACEPYAELACRAPAAAEAVARPSNLFDFQHDEVLRAFLAARARTGAAEWKCPGLPGTARPSVAQPFVAPAWRAPLRPVVEAWANGEGASARALLAQASVDSAQRASLQQLLDEVDRAGSQVRERLAAADPDLDAAEDAYRRVLELDTRLRLSGVPASPAAQDRLRREPSRVREELERALASALYAHGRTQADRREWRGACLAWKRGLAISRSHLDLLKAATNVCTQRARQAAEESSCEALREGLDFAVNGDGQREAIEARLAALGCR